MITNRHPKNLTCGHSICKACSSKLVSNFKILCPFCRKTTELRENENLQTNFALLEAISLFNDINESVTEPRSSGAPPNCEEHTYNLAEFVCISPNCSSRSKLMCRTCEEFGVHAGHRKGLLQVEAKKVRQNLLERQRKLQVNKKQVDDKIQALEKAALKKNDELYKEKYDEITRHYDRIRSSVAEREKTSKEVLKKSVLTSEEDNRMGQISNHVIRHLLEKKCEEVEQLVGMTDFELYRVKDKVDWNDESFSFSDVKEKPPMELKTLHVKLPEFRFEDSS